VFVGFKRGIKGYKIWDPKDRKFILSRDVKFDEASMLKPTISQQVEIERTKEVSQQVHSDATPLSLERSVSLAIIPKVTQGSDQIAEQDADDNEIKNRLWVMFMNSLQLEDSKEIHVNQVSSL